MVLKKNNCQTNETKLRVPETDTQKYRQLIFNKEEKKYKVEQQKKKLIWQIVLENQSKKILTAKEMRTRIKWHQQTGWKNFLTKWQYDKMTIWQRVNIQGMSEFIKIYN